MSLRASSRHRAPLRRRAARSCQAGLTLLELLSVVTIISAVAYVAVDSLQEDTNQVRFDNTRNRLDMIRTAAIGNLDRTVNGQPEIRGFATDLGRLPTNARELLQPIDAGNTAIPLWQIDAASGVAAGWRGPYLNVIREQASGTLAMRDGWGSDLAAGAANSFGWKLFQVTANDLVVQSFGADGQANPAVVAEYDAQSLFEQDYPSPPNPAVDPTEAPDPIVDANEYLVDVSLVRFRVGNRTGGDFPAVATNICVRLFYPDPTTGLVTSAPSGEFRTLNTISTGDDYPDLEFTFTTPGTVTHGTRAFQILEHDGDCDAVNTELANSGGHRRFTFLPPSLGGDIAWALR